MNKLINYFGLNYGVLESLEIIKISNVWDIADRGYYHLYRYHKKESDRI